MIRKLVLLGIFISIPVQSQQSLQTMLGDSVNNNYKLKSERFRSMWNGNIKGERYYNESFTTGKVNDSTYLLRYDQYADQFEFKKRIGHEEELVERELSVVITYDSLKFYFLPYYYKSRKKFNVGYLNLVDDLDTLKVYRKYEVTFRPATFSPTTIEIGFPPRYIHRKLFFVQRRDNTPVQIGKRKLVKLYESFQMDVKVEF
jgi:hypothetical protein